MPNEFSGIERRLDELDERLARLHPLQATARAEFAQDPYLRDIVERNLEVAAQTCIGTSHRIIALLGTQKPVSYQDVILKMGDLSVVPVDLSRSLAPSAGFRNVLVHDYVAIDWDIVYCNLQQLKDLAESATHRRSWLRQQGEDLD
ncbi:MAG: DUF86 domain-containing protein [Anaerolineae bacterium]|nr:DUF86 domain-containing protein [Anaerolineae bacterium]